MTAAALMAYEIENTGYQLSACFKDLPESLRNKRSTEQGMTPREVASHLCESYLALLSHTAGKEYEWGSFSADGLEWDDLLAKAFELREQAAAAVCVEDDPKLKSGHDYIVAHDAYHVGQLCSLRIQFEPGWEPYSIYPNVIP
jgi:uncharacterized damage-inducible protein DinB